jgi:HNH endonuclease
MITQEYLKSILHYDPETGLFTWIKSIGGQSKIGNQVGHFDKDGYLRIQINGKIYRSNRLAWLYVKGIWPENGLDHKNTIKTDNRIDNLREAKNDKQKFNTDAHKNNKIGSKGIRKSGSKYQARITGPTGLYTIGSFKTLEEAEKAYAQEALKIHGEFIHETVRENL